TRSKRDWSSDVCSSDLSNQKNDIQRQVHKERRASGIDDSDSFHTVKRNCHPWIEIFQKKRICIGRQIELGLAQKTGAEIRRMKRSEEHTSELQSRFDLV